MVNVSAVLSSTGRSFHHRGARTESSRVGWGFRRLEVAERIGQACRVPDPECKEQPLLSVPRFLRLRAKTSDWSAWIRDPTPRPMLKLHHPIGIWPYWGLYLVVGVVDERGLPLALVEWVVDHGGLPRPTARGSLTRGVGHLGGLPLPVHLLIPVTWHGDLKKHSEPSHQPINHKALPFPLPTKFQQLAIFHSGLAKNCDCYNNQHFR